MSSIQEVRQLEQEILENNQKINSIIDIRKVFEFIKIYRNRNSLIFDFSNSKMNQMQLILELHVFTV